MPWRKMKQEGLVGVKEMMVMILNCWGGRVRERLTEVVTFE